MKWPHRTTLVVTVLCFLCADAPSSTYESPSLGALHIRSACIMPVEGKLYKLGMKGGESMAKESDAWSADLQAVVESHFKVTEVTLFSASSALDSNASSEEVRQVMLNVQEKYDTVAAQIRAKPKNISKERITLGDSVSLLPCAAKSDVLVFAEGWGQVITGGKQAMGVLIGGTASSSGSLSLTLIDAKTGDVMAYISLLNGSNGVSFQNNPEAAFGDGLDRQLRKLHVGPAAASQKH